MIHLTNLETVILVGLEAFGFAKTFSEILEKAGIRNVDQATKVELASALEEKGLIKNVTYRLPLNLRAELSEKGKEIVQSGFKEE
jgi:hypothetical protein